MAFLFFTRRLGGPAPSLAAVKHNMDGTGGACPGKGALSGQLDALEIRL